MGVVTRMANFWDDDIEAEDESDLVKQLREVIKKGKKANEEFETELKQLRPQVRTASVSSILSGLKVNPKIAKVIPSDVEANEEAVKAWLDEYGDLFGAQSQATGDDSSAQTEEEDVQEFDPNAAAQWQRIQTVGSQSGVTTPDAESAQLAMLQSAAKAADGNADKYFAYLKGEIPIPTS
jgi:hypothetical protein